MLVAFCINFVCPGSPGRIPGLNGVTNFAGVLRRIMGFGRVSALADFGDAYNGTVTGALESGCLGRTGVAALDGGRFCETDAGLNADFSGGFMNGDLNAFGFAVSDAANEGSEIEVTEE